MRLGPEKGESWGQEEDDCRGQSKTSRGFGRMGGSSEEGEGTARTRLLTGQQEGNPKSHMSSGRPFCFPFLSFVFGECSVSPPSPLGE